MSDSVAKVVGSRLSVAEIAITVLYLLAIYSVCDWKHPDYPLGSPAGKTQKLEPDMDRYYTYLKNQTKELIDIYGPLEVMWFDGEWEEPWTRTYGNELYTFLRNAQPAIPMKITNAIVRTGGTVNLNQTTETIELNVSTENRDSISTVIELTVDGKAFDIEPVGITL